MFCRGEYPRPRQVFDDAIITKDRDKRYHDNQQPLSEALFYVGASTRPKAVACDPYQGSGTTACAVARLGQGRRFWGAEIDAKTCANARSRVAQELTVGGPPEIPMKATAGR